MPMRLDAECPRCGSVERSRLSKIWLDEHQPFGDVIHFAPEDIWPPYFASKAKSFRRADIDLLRADIILNTEAMNLPDASVDLFVCSHILEHVDDTKALREMYRTLRPGGKALITTPVLRDGLRRMKTHPSRPDPTASCILAKPTTYAFSERT